VSSDDYAPILVSLAFFLLLTVFFFLMVRKLAPPTLSARTESPMDVSVMMRVVVSFAALVARLYVILNHSYAADDKKRGYGIVGTVVGYWLRAAAKLQLTHSVKRHSEEARSERP
jgi:hypothetical protein